LVYIHQHCIARYTAGYPAHYILGFCLFSFTFLLAHLVSCSPVIPFAFIAPLLVTPIPITSYFIVPCTLTTTPSLPYNPFGLDCGCLLVLLGSEQDTAPKPRYYARLPDLWLTLPYTCAGGPLFLLLPPHAAFRYALHTFHTTAGGCPHRHPHPSRPHARAPRHGDTHARDKRVGLPAPRGFSRTFLPLAPPPRTAHISHTPAGICPLTCCTPHAGARTDAGHLRPLHWTFGPVPSFPHPNAMPWTHHHGCIFSPFRAEWTFCSGISLFLFYMQHVLRQRYALRRLPHAAVTPPGRSTTTLRTNDERDADYSLDAGYRTVRELWLFETAPVWTGKTCAARVQGAARGLLQP